MRTAVLCFAFCLLVFATVPTVDAAPQPVGSCGEDATVEYCSVHCIQPPCPMYVCVHKADVGCHRI